MDDQVAKIILRDIKGIREDIKDGNKILHERISDGFTKLGERTDSLESWRDKIKGGAKLFGIMGGFVIVIIGIIGILIKMGVIGT